MNQNNSYKNFSYVTIGRIIETILIGFFYVFFAALLDPEKYGHLNVIIALAATFSIISRFGLNFSLQVFQSKKNFVLVKSINTVFLISTLVATIVLIGIDINAALLCLGLSFFVMNFHWILGLKQYKKFMWLNILKGVLVISIPFPLYFFLDIPGIIFGMAIANFIPSFQYLRRLKLNRFVDLKKNYKVLVHNFGFEAGGTLPFMVDKLIISSLFGLYVVGIYQLNLQIFLALSVIPGSLGTYLISEESSGSTHYRISIVVVFASIGIAILGIFLTPLIINEFFPKYSEGIMGLQILLITLIPESIGSIFMAKLLSKESTRIGYLAIVKITSMLILLVYLGEIYDYVGLSLAILISSIISVIYLFYINRKS